MVTIEEILGSDQLTQEQLHSWFKNDDGLDIDEYWLVRAIKRRLLMK